MPLTKTKGQETTGGKTREEFISGRPTLGRQQTSVSKTVSKALTILAGLSKRNVGQRSVGTCRWTLKVRWIIVLGSITWDLAGIRAVPVA